MSRSVKEMKHYKSYSEDCNIGNKVVEVSVPKINDIDDELGFIDNSAHAKNRKKR